MWSGASVAHTAQVQEDLGSILTQTQMALKELSSPFFQTTDLKMISLICYIVMSSRNKIILLLKKDQKRLRTTASGAQDL
jgi:hypothetical protein